LSYKIKYVLTFFTLITIFFNVNAQDDSIIGNSFLEEEKIDTTTNSLEYNTINKRTSITLSQDSLENPVTYFAEDSILYLIPEKKILLFGRASIQYEKINILADNIIFDWEKNEVLASMNSTSGDSLIPRTQFTDGENTFQAETIKFNFKTKKGKSTGIITKFDEGILHSKIVKVINDSTMFAKTARYTTCEYDHPHYYIEVGKAKIIKDRLIVGKPANLVIEDIHTPLFLPFAIYPTIKNRTSGLILPQWGQSPSQGFFLLGGGYYWAINDKMDLTTTADIYTRGSWGVQTSFNYIKRYAFSNSINLGLSGIKDFERQDPNKPKTTRQFNILWNFNMDQRKMYNSSFSGSINIVSNTYNKVNFNSDRTTALNNQFSSSIAYNKQFKGKYPSQLNLNINHSQNTQSKIINLTIPSLSYNLNRIMPFQRKVKIGGAKWYENIGFTYNMSTSNQISGTDSTFFTKKTLQDMQGGIRHSAPLSGSFKLLKYFNFSYNFDYNSRWYYKFLDKTYLTNPDTIDSKAIFVRTDTKYGFKMVRDFGLSGGFNTRTYGMFQFKKGKLKAIRHVFTPSLNYRFRPDFSKPRWNYYETVQIDTLGNTEMYSFYQNNIYGTASRGKEASIGLSVGNNIEIKVFSKKDSINHSKKIPILDNLGFNIFYNFAKDSQRLEPLSFSGNTKVLEFINISFAGILDWYSYNKFNNTRLKTFRITTDKKLMRLTSFNLSLNGSYTSKANKNKLQNTPSTNILQLNDPVFNQPIAQVNFDIPWSIRYGYNLSLRKFYKNGKDTASISQYINLSGEFNITPKWKVNVATGYDITNKEISRTDISVFRDLHCWQMAFNWVPLGIQKSFSIRINIKSQALSFLQLNKRKSWFDYP
jgi:lipopolysaccharide assembly outer membrane protein LptD (OstA)